MDNDQPSTDFHLKTTDLVYRLPLATTVWKGQSSTYWKDEQWKKHWSYSSLPSDKDRALSLYSVHIKTYFAAAKTQNSLKALNLKKADSLQRRASVFPQIHYYLRPTRVSFHICNRVATQNTAVRKGSSAGWWLQLIQTSNFIVTRGFLPVKQTNSKTNDFSLVLLEDK